MGTLLGLPFSPTLGTMSGEVVERGNREGSSELLRNNAVVALGTGLSRFTGMLRVIVFGVVVGQTALADAYDGANNSPNAVYELLLGGVLSAALVPMFLLLVKGDYGAQLMVLGLTFGIFFGTLSLRKPGAGDASTTHPGHG